MYIYHTPLPHSWNPLAWTGVLDTALCNKVYQWLGTGRWFLLPGKEPDSLIECIWYRLKTLRSVGQHSKYPVSSTNKTDRHQIAEILLKVALNTIKTNQTIHERTHWIMLVGIKCHVCHQFWFYERDITGTHMSASYLRLNIHIEIDSEGQLGTKLII